MTSSSLIGLLVAFGLVGLIAASPKSSSLRNGRRYRWVLSVSPPYTNQSDKDLFQNDFLRGVQSSNPLGSAKVHSFTTVGDHQVLEVDVTQTKTLPRPTIDITDADGRRLRLINVIDLGPA